MDFIKKNWKGMLACLCIAVPSWLLGKKFPIIGGPVIAIIAGMVITLMIKDKSALESGIKYTSKKILQYAVVLLGFGLNLEVIFKTGRQSLPIIISTITTSLVIAYVLHRVMHIPGKISTLVGVGSSICGGSAIAATAPVIDADDEEVAQAISVIFYLRQYYFLHWARFWDSPRIPARLLESSRVPRSMTLRPLQRRRPPGTACMRWEMPRLTRRLR